ncbi:sugar transporter [Rhodobacter sp. TJ_12]|nr:sugar transporter [Rhodobacter sp. TJ_12]
MSVPRPVSEAGIEPRHRWIFISFLGLVVLPTLLTAFYLCFIADDQYSTKVGFYVRSEETESAESLLSGLSSLSGTSSSDTDVLYEYIQSQALVEKISSQIDLPGLYSKPAFDPVFAYQPDGVIEDLTDYWQRMVKVSYTSGSGLIQLDVRAFTPEDSLMIANAIVDGSSEMINDLSAIAREDATRYAREDMAVALDRLKSAREALTTFRSRNRMVDPDADIQGQMGLLNSLEAQLAESYIELNLLEQTAKENDPRLEQSQRRIEVIQGLIERERQKFGIGGQARGDEEADYSTLVGEFEKLAVDLKYAEEAYLTAQAALDAAQAEAQRKSRYLATYAKPTLPQKALYPQRGILSLITALFLTLLWSIGVLVYYSVRDRR